jgi:hypothetical protein
MLGRDLPITGWGLMWLCGAIYPAISRLEHRAVVTPFCTTQNRTCSHPHRHTIFVHVLHLLPLFILNLIFFSILLLSPLLSNNPLPLLYLFILVILLLLLSSFFTALLVPIPFCLIFLLLAPVSIFIVFSS